MILRSAPVLDRKQVITLKEELEKYLHEADWFTVGIMANSQALAIKALRSIEKQLKWKAITIESDASIRGPVFLKANQKSNNVYIRVEYGLGEGILLSCQNNEMAEKINTFGPLPLSFFDN